jgi:hypothetical protein
MKSEMQQFYQDLRASVFAGVSIECGEKWAPSAELRLKDIEAFESFESAGSQTSTVRSNDRLEAAIETYKHTGSMLPVLEGLSTRVNAWRRVKRLFRRSMFYVICVSAVAVTGLVVFHRYVAPQMQMVRQDLIEFAGAKGLPNRFDVIGMVPYVSALFAILLAAMIVWMLLGGIARMGWWIGGRQYVRYQTMASAIRAMRMLVASGVPKREAATIGVRLAAVDKFGRAEILHVVETMDDDAIQSSQWTDYLKMVAERQYLSARSYGPLLLVTVICGLIALIYTLLVYGPFVSLLYDLAVRIRV